MMNESKVTIVVPTYNRSGLLKIGLQSILSQDHSDFRVIVLDNASTDDTQAVVSSFGDHRVSYTRNETNIGAFRNSNRAIEVNRSPYLAIFQDDDVMLPGFIRESVLALDQNPHAAFSFAPTGAIDIDGKPVAVKSIDRSDPIPEGAMNGLEFLHRLVWGHKWIIQTSAVMMRSAALAVTGIFENRHCKDTGDFNLYYRLASQFDVAFIAKELCHIRYHKGRESHVDYDFGTGMLAGLAERIDAIGHLIQSPRAADPAYRVWLKDRLLFLNLRRSQETQLVLPSLNLGWAQQLQIASEEIKTIIPEGNRFILVDENAWGTNVAEGRSALPFLERNGLYWGPPPNDEIAIQELERLRSEGANYVVFGWPAFWCFDYYGGMREYLTSRFRCLLSNGRLIAFDLHSRN